MITLIQDTLTLWREAEQTLDRLPSTSSDHETVARLVSELGDAYVRLTALGEWTATDIERNRDAIKAGRELLRQVRTPISRAEATT